MKFLMCFIVSFLAYAPFAHAQPKECSEIGCVNGLTLRVDPDYDWKTGNYDSFFKLGAKSVTCQGRLPLKPCD
jgi:hypothetical protein